MMMVVVAETEEVTGVIGSEKDFFAMGECA